jgi:hypothetical protein
MTKENTAFITREPSMMARFFGIAILGLVLLFPAGETVQGQDATLAEYYGRGVQAYFNGEYEESVELLSKAISLESPDPRCHFFRGLAHAKLDKQEEAAADFKNGGDLEALDVGEKYSVSKALTRIQGQVRVAIEASRRLAKEDLKALQEKRRRVRYEKNVINEKAAVRKTPEQGAQIVKANEKILATLPTLPADATRNLSNPFNIPVEKLASSGLLGGANSRPSAGNPTRSQPVASTGNDPFAKPTVAEPAATVNNTPAAGSDPADPFANNPVAGSNPAKPAAVDAADPFAPPKPAAGGDAADPFAPKPAAGGDVADPFAPAKPAAGNAAREAPKKGIFGSLFRAVGVGVGKSVGGDEATVDDTAPKPDNAPANPADPFGGGAKPPAKPADPFGGGAKPPAKPVDPFGGGAKPPAKPADPFGGGAKPAPAGGNFTAEQIIGFLDKNKDGKISKDEASDEMKPNFQFIDTNGDGGIDLEEAKVMVNFINKESKPGNAPVKPADPFGGGAKPPAKPADPFGGGAKPPAKPADPFGGNDPFGGGAKPADKPAKPAAKPADPFGGNDPFKR